MSGRLRATARSVAPYVLLGAVAAVPIFYQLGQRGFWGDEVWTVWWSRLFTWRTLFFHFSAPPDLPLLFYLIKAAAVMMGESTFSARLPSALMAIGSVLLIFQIARNRLRAWTAFSAALVLAIAPLHVWYGQEARAYAALEFLSLLSLALFLRLMKSPTVFAVLAFSVGCALMVYDHLFGLFPWFVLVLSGVALVAIRWVGPTSTAEQPSRARIAVGLGASALITLLLLAPIVPGIVGFMTDQSAAETSGTVFDLAWLNHLLGGFGAGEGLPVIVLTVLFAAGVVAAIARREALGLIAVLWVVLPLAIVYLVKPAHGLIGRYVIFMVPIYLLMLVHGIGALVEGARSLIAARTTRTLPRANVVASVLVGALLIFMLPLTGSASMALRGTDWSGMCEYLRANAQPGDVIVGNQYFNPAMSWCFPVEASGVVVADEGYPLSDLVASGRPSWYVQIDVEPLNPQVSSLGYTQIDQSLIERPGTKHDDPRAAFPYLISEHGSRLFRGPAVAVPARIEFHDHRGSDISPSSPRHASIRPQSSLPFRLALTQGIEPGRLTLNYVDGPSRITEVTANGIEVARLSPQAPEDTWKTASIDLPPGLPRDVAISIAAAGDRDSAISDAELVAR